MIGRWIARNVGPEDAVCLVLALLVLLIVGGGLVLGIWAVAQVVDVVRQVQPGAG